MKSKRKFLKTKIFSVFCMVLFLYLGIWKLVISGGIIPIATAFDMGTLTATLVAWRVLSIILGLVIAYFGFMFGLALLLAVLGINLKKKKDRWF
ncbi:MAG: hypothetical protein E6469_13265 [Clostridium perfringens]|uniref:hypothetical protein n=1 Tax=Clostridium perfringens TaxID=1502 RepID=UPI00290A4C47|nr:hypothetical protein [Clostridium perfringens]MDU6691771.1 hypothetical protein [Clostridium perfringens]MDZ5069196.1 hypothetical protein [Clostridium perfringens]MDZ5075428.1 hypothetical protein [Clostridium perfringens]